MSAHRQAIQVALQVIGKVVGRMISPLRLFAHGHQDDRIQVSAKRPLESLGRAPRYRSNLTGLLGNLFTNRLCDFGSCLRS